MPIGPYIKLSNLEFFYNPLALYLHWERIISYEKIENIEVVRRLGQVMSKKIFQTSLSKIYFEK